MAVYELLAMEFLQYHQGSSGAGPFGIVAVERSAVTIRIEGKVRVNAMLRTILKE